MAAPHGTNHSSPTWQGDGTSGLERELIVELLDQRLQAAVLQPQASCRIFFPSSSSSGYWIEIRHGMFSPDQGDRTKASSASVRGDGGSCFPRASNRSSAFATVA